FWLQLKLTVLFPAIKHPLKQAKLPAMIHYRLKLEFNHLISLIEEPVEMFHQCEHILPFSISHVVHILRLDHAITETGVHHHTPNDPAPTFEPLSNTQLCYRPSRIIPRPNNRPQRRQNFLP